MTDLDLSALLVWLVGLPCDETDPTRGAVSSRALNREWNALIAFLTHQPNNSAHLPTSTPPTPKGHES